MKSRLSLGTAALAAVLSITSIHPAQAATRSRRTPPSESNEYWYGSRLPSSAQKEASKLQKEEPLAVIPIPVFGIDPGGFTDTWGEARSAGRTHEGTDIMAPKDSYVIAPTESVVSEIGVGELGGNFVYTINPGGERYYFAHLDKYAEGLEVGDILKAGDLIGYVGNTGNAAGGATHLHFGIYAGGAQNPFPRLTETLPLDTRVDTIAKIIDDADDPEAEARVDVGMYPAFFRQAVAAGEKLPKEVSEALASTVATSGGSTAGIGARDLTIGSQGADVVKLQSALIKQAKGPAATALASAGATGYFGSMTRAALAEWQASVGIAPAAGYYGPLTRSRMGSLALL